MTAAEHALRFFRFVNSGHPAVLAAFVTDGHDSAMMTGRWDDLCAMATWATGTSNDDPGLFRAFYFALNPARQDQLKNIGNFGTNSMKYKGRSLKARAVSGRALYMIDFDPVRPSGVCSTDDEKADALGCAQRVEAYLKEHGWPDPIWIDSGNGYHLLYRGDMCDPDSPVWRFLLKSLSQLYSTDRVTIDTSVADPAQLGRVPGTWNAKGPNTRDRPHRRCRVLSYPEQWLAVDYGTTLYRLASEHGYGRTSAKKFKGHGNMPDLADDIHDLIYEFAEEFPDHLSIEKEREGDSATYFDLAFCPFAGRKHTGYGGKTSIILTATAVGFHCFSDDCNHLGMQDLRAYLFEETGAWPETSFYVEDEDREERLYAKWGLSWKDEEEEEEEEEEDEEGEEEDEEREGCQEDAEQGDNSDRTQTESQRLCLTEAEINELWKEFL